jgi:ribonuclease T2
MKRALCLLVVVCLAAFAASKKKVHPHGEPGQFDYYLLSLSWSPQHCSTPAGARDSLQCGDGRTFGFVVHGLWPQFERGFPSDCEETDPVRSGIVRQMLRLMPAEQLIQHEWATHGTCSGLDQPAYFKKIEQAYANVKIPLDYSGPLKQIEVSSHDIHKEFNNANPTFPEDSIKVLCTGRFLSEVRICYTKDLKPRACSAEVRDTCKVDPIIMRPVR